MIGSNITAMRFPREACKTRVAGAIAAVALVAAAAGAGPDPSPELGFEVGETIVYRLQWGVIPVGTARVVSEWTADEPARIRLRVHVRSNAFLDRIYRIDDTVESLVDPATFLPVSFEKNMDEGGWHRRDITEFDRENGRVRWRSLLGPETIDYEAPREVRDILSMMYALRSGGFVTGERRDYVVAGDEGLASVRLDVGKTRVFDHDRYGAVPAIRIRPTVGKDALFLGRVPKDIWVSNDDLTLLLLLSVDAPVGNIHLILDAIEGTSEGVWPGRPRG